MIIQLRNTRHLTIDRVLVGGGGNQVAECRKMSLRWIRQGVEQMATTEEWPAREGQWEQVNLA